MLDLETLGNKPGSVIVAIGAAKFGNGEILDSFYERVDAESCVSLGLRMDVPTVMWWLQQNDAARHEITQPGGKLPEVLMRFSAWVHDLNAEVWGNVIHAHNHRASMQTGRRTDNPTGVSVGALMDVRKAGYAKNRKSTYAWSAGFAFGEYTDSQTVVWLHQQPQDATEWRLPL